MAVIDGAARIPHFRDEQDLVWGLERAGDMRDLVALLA